MKNSMKLAGLAAAMTASLVMTGCNNVKAADITAIKPVTAVHSGIDSTHSKYANEREMQIDDVIYPIRETSARPLVNAKGDAPELVADIFDGKADKAVAGYKIMVMNRTTSITAEARTLQDGRIIDNNMVHRGSKALIGIPVVKGKAALDAAVLLDLDIIYDDFNAPLIEGKTFKDRGQKLTRPDVAVDNKKITIRSLTLPNFASGENAGGGIDFVATATIDGKKVTTGANSAFQIFYTATPNKARGF